MRYVIAIALLLFSASAFAQSPGTVNLVGPSGSPGAPQITPGAVNAAVNAAFTAKADLSGLNAEITRAATAESLLLPLAGGTVSGPVIFESPLLFSGLSSGTQVACVGLDSGNHVVLNLASCGTGSGAVTWPSSGVLIVSNGTNTPGSLPEVDGECALGVGGIWTAGSCGGLAVIEMKDLLGNSLSNISTQFFGPGFVLSGTSPGGTVNLNQPNRLVTTCSGTPSPCLVTALDMGGQVNFNGSSLTVAIPAFTNVTPTASFSGTAMTVSSGSGVSVGDLVADGGVHLPPGVIVISGSGTSWTLNQSVGTISSETVTISFGGSGQGFTVTNRNSTGLTISSTPAINLYPGGATGTIPQNGGMACLSNGSTLDCPGLANQPNQAYTNLPQTWTGAQTWGASYSAPNIITGTTYAIAATDCGGVLLTTNAAAVTITTLGTLPPGCDIAITQVGAGQVSIANGTGATLTTSVNGGAATHTRAQYSKIGIDVVANSGGSAAQWNLVGDGS